MSDIEERAAAALKRRENVRSLADRPSQRRWAEHFTSKPMVRARMHDVEIREAADDGSISFRGVASAYEAGYEMFDFFGPYTEIVSAGAGARSLANPDLDVPLVLQHDSLRRIAKTSNGSLELSETPDGLQVNAPALDATDVDVAYIVPKLRSGLIDEMSFMFRITDGQWSPDYTEFRINSYDINRGDVAIVGFGANPATTATLRAEVSEQVARQSAPAGMSFARLLTLS